MRAALVIFIIITVGIVVSCQEVSAVHTHQMTSKVFDNTRAIRVLVPPGYEGTKTDDRSVRSGSEGSQGL